MKRIITCIFTATLLFATTVRADNATGCMMLLNNIKASIDMVSFTSKQCEVKDQNAWLAAAREAKASLCDVMNVTFTNFDEDTYDIDLITSYDVSINARGTMSGKDANITYTFVYNPNYKYLRVSENPSLYYKLSIEERRVWDKIKKVCEGIQGTDYEKEKQIHDYIVANYTYTTGAIQSRSHTVTGLIEDGEGVCEAYATLFQLMCNISGVDCRIATGTLNSADHMWNIVKLDGQYYNVDVTSDDPVPDYEGRVRYTFFNIADTEFSKTHKADEGTVKCEGTTYNYYTYSNHIAHSKEDVVRILKESLENKDYIYANFKTEGYVIKTKQEFLDIVGTVYKGKVGIAGEPGEEGEYFVTEL